MDSKTIKLETPCKINLVLDVLGRMSSGYHALRSLYTTINLCDELELTYHPYPRSDQPQLDHPRSDRPPPGQRTLTAEFDARLQNHLQAVARAAGQTWQEQESIASFAGADNLVLRALDACLECVRVNAGSEGGLSITGEFVVHLRKRVPFSAGLGGGSANAAGMIRAFQGLFPGSLSEQDAARIAAEVGSDVALFLQPGLGVFWGRGERVLPLPSADFLAGMSCLLIKPAYGSVTAEAYAGLRADFLPLELESNLDKVLLAEEFAGAVRVFSGGYELHESDIAQVSRRLTDSGRQSNRTSASDALLSEGFTGTTVFTANVFTAKGMVNTGLVHTRLVNTRWLNWLRNSFAASVGPDKQSEQSSIIASELRRCGAEGVVLCGSGSCWAGLSQGQFSLDEQLMAQARQHGWFVCQAQLGYSGLIQWTHWG